MLKLLRDKGIKKKIYIALAVAVVASFVVSGILIGTDDARTGAALAKFENRKITISEFLSNYRAVQRQAAFMYGDKLNEVRSRIDFKAEAWDRLLLLEYAKKHGIRATDSEVVDWITRQEGFRRGGRFDDAYYRQYVERAQRMTARQFEEEIRQMLTLGKVQLALEGSDAAGLSDEKLKELYLSENTEKDLVYGLVTAESMASQVPDPAAEETSKLFEMVKDKLTDPKTGKPLTPEEALEEIKSKMKASKTQELALAKLGGAMAKVKAPGDFESVLKAEGVTVERLAKYKKGIYPAGVWPSENLQNAVAPLGKDGISGVFDTPRGAMAVKVENVYPADEKKFEEEKAAFREKIESRSGRTKIEAALTELRSKLSLNVELMRELFPAENAAPQT